MNGNSGERSNNMGTSGIVIEALMHIDRVEADARHLAASGHTEALARHQRAVRELQTRTGREDVASNEFLDLRDEVIERAMQIR